MMTGSMMTTTRPTTAAPRIIKRVVLLIMTSCCLMVLLFWDVIFLNLPTALEQQAGYLLSFQPPPFRTNNTNDDDDKSLATDDRNDSFSACLLIMDDNHRLVEWLAYHYHVLPLRYLIVAVDPRSATSPSMILDEWRQYGTTIDEWTDADIFEPNDKNAPKKHTQDSWNKLNEEQRKNIHRYRQKKFMKQCLVAMKQANRTWVLFEDSDEYLVYNGPPNSNNRNKTQQHGASSSYPSVHESSSLIAFLNKEVNRPNSNFTSPCIAIPRLRFGSVESDANHRDHTVPSTSLFNATNFDTLRWRHHAPRDNIQPYNGLAKTIVDVSRIANSNISSQAVSAHRPLPLCPRPFVADKDSMFRIHHYSGSWEAYSYRDDARWGSDLKGRQNYEKKNEGMIETDDNIRPWLSGFVEQHGVEKASKMLRGVGVFTPKNTTTTVA